MKDCHHRSVPAVRRSPWVRFYWDRRHRTEKPTAGAGESLPRGLLRSTYPPHKADIDDSRRPDFAGGHYYRVLTTVGAQVDTAVVPSIGDIGGVKPQGQFTVAEWQRL